VLLRDAGYTVSQLKAGGATAAELLAVPCSITELKAVGFTAAQCLEADLDETVVEAIYMLPPFLERVSLVCAPTEAKDMLKEGTGGLLKLLRASGSTCDMAKRGGLLPSECHQAGYSHDEAKAAGFSRGIHDWMTMELKNPHNKWTQHM
jgi:hypothetical protein